MNLVGKIFVFLVFAMSLVFMSFAVMVYSTQTNWRTENAKYKVRIEEAQKQLATLEAELAAKDKRIAEVMANRAMALAKLETANVQLAKETADSQAQFAALTKSNADAAAQLAVTEGQLKELAGSIEKLRVENKEARTNEVAQFQKAAAVQEKINQATSMVNVLTDRKKNLEEELARYKLAVSRLPKGTVSFEAGPPQTKGEVLVTNEKDQIVTVSLGTDDGFAAGNQLEVFRGLKYIGRLRLVSMENNRSVGEVIKEYKQDQILKGDNVIAVLQNKK